MNGGQDLGGLMGFGAVVPEPVVPVFHREWERRAFAITLAMGMTGSWNIDMSRYARERIPTLEYWQLSYYEIWMKGLETLLVEAGLDGAAKPVKRVAKAEMIPAILAGGGPANRPTSEVQLFYPGDRIRTINHHTEDHTRLPRYARNKQGEILRVHGAHVLPDSSAHGKGDCATWVYNVAFSARELWGHNNNDRVVLDLWQPYLEKA